MVQLPILDANESLALAQQLNNAATGETIPASVTVALGDVTADRDALQKVIGTATTLEDVPGVRTIDLVEDAAWATTRDFLAVWGSLPEEIPEGVRATASCSPSSLCSVRSRHVRCAAWSG